MDQEGTRNLLNSDNRFLVPCQETHSPAASDHLPVKKPLRLHASFVATVRDLRNIVARECLGDASHAQ
jgi:hypothetical protein